MSENGTPRTVDDIDPEFGYQSGLRVHAIMQTIADPAVSDEELGLRLRAFVKSEGAHFFGMIFQVLWDRVRGYAAVDEDDDDGEGEDEEAEYEDVVDCPSCGAGVVADGGIPEKPCAKCGFDFKTGKIRCASCRMSMMPQAPDAVIVETKRGGQRIYHQKCAPQDGVIGEPRPARHPDAEV